MNHVQKHMAQALQSAAFAAAQNIQEFTNGKQEKKPLSLDEKKHRVKKIDIAADNAFRQSLENAPIEFHGIDAEGGKEAHPDKLGEAMPLSIGVFGKGEMKASFVLDVIEGTTAAAHNHPNAISIAGVSEFKKILKVPQNPKTNRTHIYYRKLFAPRAFKSAISIEMSPEENLKKIMKLAKIPSSHITVAAMNRQANTSVIKAAQKLGVKLVLVEAGDLLWGLKAILSDPENPVIMMGRGGAEEGAITQIAAHALNATGQLQAMIEEHDIETIDKTPIWNPVDYVASDPENSAVLFTAVTDNTHFEIPQVKIEKEGWSVHTVLINHVGMKKTTQFIPHV